MAKSKKAPSEAIPRLEKVLSNLRSLPKDLPQEDRKKAKELVEEAAEALLAKTKKSGWGSYWDLMQDES
jgi:hypothetical protein